MAGYLYTEATFELEDHYDSNGNDRWQKTNLNLKVDKDGKVSYTITMTNDSSVNGYGSGRGVYLNIEADGHLIAGCRGVDPNITVADGWPSTSNYVAHGSDFNAPGYKVYPCGNNTSYSKSNAFTVTADTFSITIKICCMQSMANPYQGRGATQTFTFTRTKWEDGVAPASAPTIKATALNKFQVNGVNGTKGHNNEIKTSTIYYTLNGTQGSVPNLSTASQGAVSADIDAAAYRDNASLEIKAWVVNTFVQETTSKESGRATKTFKAINSPSISITDNKNNTFSLTGKNATLPTGSNNAVSSNTFTWGYASNNYNNKHTDDSLSYNLQSTTAASRDVYAKAQAVPRYFGTTKTAYANPNPTAITYYVAPNNPGIPVLSYTKNRLTLREPWTFSWNAAEPGNAHGHNVVRGYRIRLYKNDKTIHIYNSSGTQLTKLSGIVADDYVYDSESTTTRITIDPVKHGFKVGDTVELGIYAYSKNGIDGMLFSGNASDERVSEAATVQNAGVMHVKDSNAWKEGQVYIKVGNAWKEAETVSVKTSTGWKESQ